MESMERTRKSMGRLSRATEDVYGRVLDHAVALRERNVRFALGVMEDSAREVRRQAESNRALAEELVGRVEEQRDAVRALIGESVEAYLDLVYAPLEYYRRGLRVAEVEVARAVGELPIEGYDGLTVNDIAGRLDGLSVEELRVLREYEKANKNRDTLVERLERRIQLAAS